MSCHCGLILNFRVIKMIFLLCVSAALSLVGFIPMVKLLAGKEAAQLLPSHLHTSTFSRRKTQTSFYQNPRKFPLYFTYGWVAHISVKQSYDKEDRIWLLNYATVAPGIENKVNLINWREWKKASFLRRFESVIFLKLCRVINSNLIFKI